MRKDHRHWHSQSGAKTDADNTISAPSAFGDHPKTSNDSTTMQKEEYRSEKTTSNSSSSSSDKDVVQSKKAEDHHQPQKEEESMKDSIKFEKKTKEDKI